MKLTEDQQQALLEILKVMTGVFWGPDLEKCSEMMQKSFLHSFKKLAATPGNWNVHEINLVLTKFMNVEAFFQHLEEGYVRLFINDRKGVAAPLYESCYDNAAGGEKALLMGAPAIDMLNRFESKGLSLSEHIHEPPDHISIEIEYLYFLLAKGWSDKDKDLIDEASRFAADIMLPWVTQFQAGLAVEKKCRFYPLMASLLAEILEFIAALNSSIKNA